MPWGVAAAAVGVGGAVYSSSKTSKAAKKAGERETEASAAALERQEEAFDEAKMALSPYAAQETAASGQMMAQLGLAPPAAGTGGGGGWGGGGGYGTGGGVDSKENLANFDNVLREMMTQAQVLYKRSGYNKSNIHREAANYIAGKLDDLRKSDRLPEGYTMPNVSELTNLAAEIEDSYGGHSKMAKNLYPEIKGGKEGAAAFREGWDDNFDTLAGRYSVTMPGDIAPPDAAGGVAGDPDAMGAGGAAAPQAKTAADIMELAGVEGLPQEIQDQYMTDLMEDPRTDPELAEYLGLTEGSMQVGAGYQDTPAYAAAREAGVEAVDASAAAGGGLYSGRRGKALRDVGQEVEQGYYIDAMNRREQMMQARRGERTGAIGRRGVEYGAGKGREQSYYNNYMQMLSAMSAPTTTTNIASMGTSLGREAAANITGTARNIGDLEIGTAGAEGAAIADITGGMMNMASSYIGRDQP